MEKPVVQLIYLSCSALLFFLAITIGLQLYEELSRTLDLTYEASTELDTALETGYAEAVEETVRGSVILMSIYHLEEIGADIVVDGNVYLQSLDVRQTDLSAVDWNRNYSVTYERNAQGKLVRIIYLSR